MTHPFTRGPWGIEKTEKAWYVGPMRPDGIKVDDFVCYVEVGPEYRDSYREKNKANALLIAAAPDLLEALKMMIDEEADFLLSIDAAEAAIAKAEGRS